MFLQSQGKAGSGNTGSSPNPPPLPHSKQARGGKQRRHRAGSRALVKRVQVGGVGEGRYFSDMCPLGNTTNFCGKQNAAFLLTAKMSEFPRLSPN